MRCNGIPILIALLGLLFIPSAAPAEDELPVSSDHRIDFFLVYDSLSLSLEIWDDTTPPDTVKLTAYRVASGFLAGMRFHFEGNRDRITVLEQVDQVVDELDYLGHTPEDSCYRFDFACWIPTETIRQARTGRSYQGHGISGEQNLALARQEARKQAFEEAIRSALSEMYTRQNKLLPGVLDGRITWYEIASEGRDQESGDYVFDINAWIKVEEE